MEINEKVKKPRLRTKGTRKKGCKACIKIREYILYPDYKIDSTIVSSSSKWKVRQLKEEKLRNLKVDLEQGVAKGKPMYYVSLPTIEAHHLTHPTGGIYGLAQKIHPKLVEKIYQLVSEGVVSVPEMKRALEHFVKHELCQIKPPDPNDCAYYPSNTDIKNHMYCAKTKLQLSKFDQENLTLKIQQWKQLTPDSLFFFCPFKRKPVEQVMDDVNATAAEVNEFDQCLLFIHQEKWQKELLLKYGNVICLMDATYKTTKYELPLFFICVKTNVGYSIVAEFITQFETTSHIEEALNMLKKWNPAWHPSQFMCDYSESEISALRGSFPGVKVYLCDFH